MFRSGSEFRKKIAGLPIFGTDKLLVFWIPNECDDSPLQVFRIIV
jgi:hypothetical protein